MIYIHDKEVNNTSELNLLHDITPDLNMGYYHIQLSENTSNLCTTILPWGANSPDIFQQKMNDLFHGFEFIYAYIDGILILTKGDWTDHVQKLELTLNKLKENGLKFNIEKSLFVQTEIEYLGSWVTRDGIKPMSRKIEAIINYYRRIWPRRSHTLASLTRLMSIKLKFKWAQVEQDAFNKINLIVACDTLLTYSGLNENIKSMPMLVLSN